MTCASDGLFLSWPEESAEGVPMAPSVMVREVLDIFPSGAMPKSFGRTTCLLCAQRKTALHVFGRVTDKNSAQAAALGSLLENGAYAEQYRRICYPARPEGFVIESGETARALFGSQMRLSPSKIDRYHQCRFAYFCERGLGIKKAPQGTVVSNGIGHGDPLCAAAGNLAIPRQGAVRITRRGVPSSGAPGVGRLLAGSHGRRTGQDGTF